MGSRELRLMVMVFNMVVIGMHLHFSFMLFYIE